MPVDRLAMHVLWYLADTGKYHRRVDFIFDRQREDRERRPTRTTLYIQDASDLQEPVARAWGEAWEWLIVRGLCHRRSRAQL